MLAKRDGFGAGSAGDGAGEKAAATATAFAARCAGRPGAETTKPEGTCGGDATEQPRPQASLVQVSLTSISVFWGMPGEGSRGRECAGTIDAIGRDGLPHTIEWGGR